MAQEFFTIENLPKFDFGMTTQSLNAALTNAVKDCMDRPHIKNARKVTLAISIVPVAVVNGTQIDCETVGMQFQITESRPKQFSKYVVMEPLHNGRLKFNPDDPHHPEGTTLFDEQEREES